MPNVFNHAFTPPQLAKINHQLSVLLDENISEAKDDGYERQLEKIIDERANLVESLLKSLDEQQTRCFAAHEIKTNDKILALVNDKRAVLRQALTLSSKSSKAIKKYHQV